ncbi:serine/threonine-protein kinase 19 homolog isoform X2 [Ananas comosus]|uniref:Serine/threonine-protein kinase 19 homolog isoform X2 n=1 Tax=Ananas comosus TaxID=4615 RepID=A0A6P5EDV3_ANACO|nr:serine/threonine-protein kinase 19 homolog isoform X2 [Ananas comosus]
MAETSRLAGTKRGRGDEEIGADSNSNADSDPRQALGLENNLTFSDTLVALQMMRSQFPSVEKSLKKEKVLRVFKLSTGQDDHAIMFMEDYLKQMASSVKRFEKEKQHDLEVFEWFKTYVMESKLDVCIAHQELCSLLSHGGEVTDRHVTLLISAGLLTRQLIDPNMYWFAIPNIGSILKGLSQGRKELLSLLNRRKYKEMPLAPLEKKRLRLSPLDMRFHLRDLIGSGHLKSLQTPAGIIVRVAKD